MSLEFRILNTVTFQSFECQQCAPPPPLPHPALFLFLSTEKSLNNNNKELEVDRKSVGKPGNKQERSSVFAVFKKVHINSPAGLEAALWLNHSHRICDICVFFLCILSYQTSKNLV